VPEDDAAAAYLAYNEAGHLLGALEVMQPDEFPDGEIENDLLEGFEENLRLTKRLVNRLGPTLDRALVGPPIVTGCFYALTYIQLVVAMASAASRAIQLGPNFPYTLGSRDAGERYRALAGVFDGVDLKRHVEPHLSAERELVLRHFRLASSPEQRDPARPWGGRYISRRKAAGILQLSAKAVDQRRVRAAQRGPSDPHYPLAESYVPRRGYPEDAVRAVRLVLTRHITLERARIRVEVQRASREKRRQAVERADPKFARGLANRGGLQLSADAAREEAASDPQP